MRVILLVMGWEKEGKKEGKEKENAVDVGVVGVKGEN